MHIHNSIYCNFKGYKCVKRETEKAPSWISVVDSLDHSYTIFCPQCYEEEATNAI